MYWSLAIFTLCKQGRFSLCITLKVSFYFLSNYASLVLYTMIFCFLLSYIYTVTQGLIVKKKVEIPADLVECS